MDQLREFERSQRCLFGGLEDHRATRGERRGELPCGHQQRVIPRDDESGHTDRLAQREIECVVGDVERLAVDFRRDAAEVFEARRDVVHVEFAFDDRLTAILCFEFREHGRVLADEFRQFEQHAAARHCQGKIAPVSVVERLAGGLHGAVDIGLARLGDDGECLTVAGLKISRDPAPPTHSLLT